MIRDDTRLYDDFYIWQSSLIHCFMCCKEGSKWHELHDVTMLCCR